MLSFNVSGLLRAAPGTARTYPVSVEELPLASELQLAAPVHGQVRLMKTGRSILATADLATAIKEQCSRCLAPVASPVRLTIHEEALPSIDLDTGQPLRTSDEPDALRLDEHHELHLEGPVAEAIFLAEPIAPLCRPDCPGLCVVCGIDLNTDPSHGHEDSAIDPRLAGLADWRPAGGGTEQPEPG
jgi:DUF177 domain-containing protein